MLPATRRVALNSENMVRNLSMGERHIFWDIATLLLLASVVVLMAVVVTQNERGWGVMQDIKKEQGKLTAQNQEMIKLLKEGSGNARATSPETPAQPGLTVAPSTLSTPATLQPACAKSRPPGMEHIPLDVPLPELPKFVRGDENADDGDRFILLSGQEPHSLNYLVERDRYSRELFARVHEPLADRVYDDLSLWEPHLALAWKKEMICLAYPKDGKAKELAHDIDTKWDSKTKEKLQIKRIAAETVDGQEAVRIAISDVNNDYGEVLKKDFGDRVDPQWWFSIDYKGQYLMDGKTRVEPDLVSERVLTALKALPNFKGRFLPVWKRQDSIIVKILGDEAARDAVDTALKAMVAAPDNKSLAIDQSASGKHEEQLLTYNSWEDYLAQEKPVFTFYLRKDVKWDDGEPFSGADAVFTFKTIMNPDTNTGPSRTSLQDCESVKLVDDNPYILRFTWGKPYFGSWSSSAGFEPIAEHYYKFTDPQQFNSGKQNEWLVGNGKYKLDKWERDQRIVLVRNDSYYGKKPHIRAVVFKIVKDPVVQLETFEKGEADVIVLTPSQYTVKTKDPEFMKRFETNMSISNGYGFVGWNIRNDLFKDKRVRQALTMMVDRERICRDTLRGLAVPIHGPVHPENPAYWKDLDKNALKFDPKRAAELLAEAGWKKGSSGVLEKDGQQFKFTLLIPSGRQETEAIANLIKDSFGQAGIEVSVNNLEWKTFIGKIHHAQFDAAMLGWSLGVEVDPFPLWHSSQTHDFEFNFCGYVNPTLDRLIEKSRRELNEGKRTEMLCEFQKIILEDQPYTFLTLSKRLIGYDRRIRNVQYKLIGEDQDRWWVPTADQKRNE